MPKLNIYNSNLPIQNPNWTIESRWLVKEGPSAEIEDDKGNMVGVTVTEHGFNIVVLKGEKPVNIIEVDLND